MRRPSANWNVVRVELLKSFEPAMYGLGQSRRFARGPASSGLPRQTDIVRAGRHVSKVPTGDIVAYSITSVAKPKTDVGISTPSIFAVFMFTTNSNLLD
jgi:hypothetical protein